MDYILAIDQGTTTTTAIIVDQNGSIIGEGASEVTQHFPHPGRVEHLGHEIQRSVELACKAALERSSIRGENIAAIGITNQRETVCLFEPGGDCLYPFIVWQCRRSSDICQELMDRGLSQHMHQITGLRIDPYFSSSKLLWLFKNHPALKDKARTGQALFGTIDSFLCHWMSGYELHISDATNACRTMLMDITTLRYRDDLLEIFDVPRACLPEIVKNTGPYGKTKGLSFLPDGIPIAAMVGDQQAALFGQGCFARGDAKATFGTGCFILLNTGADVIFSSHGMLTSIALYTDDKLSYCLEGSAFIAGAAIQFLRDGLGAISSISEVEALARSVDDSRGVLFVPALCGLGAPHWQPNMRGMLLNLDRGVTKAHVARAFLEGIALQNADILDAMMKDALAITKIKVDGGASRDDLLMQIQADLLGVDCLRPKNTQRTAFGAAVLAGLAIGLFTDANAMTNDGDHQIFSPTRDQAWALSMLESYRQAIAKMS